MLSMALVRVRGVVVSAAFDSGKEGLEYCLRTKPDLLAVDLFLPDLHGLEIVREVRARLPATRILVLTGHPDGDLPARLVAQGVHGFVDKAAPLSYIMQAMESLMEGGMFFATHVPPKGATPSAQAALPKVAAGVRSDPEAFSLEAVKVLSAREIEVGGVNPAAGDDAADGVGVAGPAERTLAARSRAVCATGIPWPRGDFPKVAEIAGCRWPHVTQASRVECAEQGPANGFRA